MKYTQLSVSYREHTLGMISERASSVIVHANRDSRYGWSYVKDSMRMLNKSLLGNEQESNQTITVVTNCCLYYYHGERRI